MKSARTCYILALTFAALAAGQAADAYTNAVGPTGVTKPWANSECWPSFDGDWNVEDNCTMPTWDLGYGMFFCGRKVYGNVATTNYAVTLPANCDLGLDLSAQRASFGAGKISIGANSKVRDISGGGRYYRCYSYAQANVTSHCPDPNVAGGMGKVLDSTNTYMPTTPIAAPADGVMCCGRAGAINGICGTANGVGAYPAPSVNLCAIGGPSAVTSAGLTWNWTCQGAFGGASSACSAPMLFEDGVCGAANGVAAYTVNAATRCAAGSPTAVTSAGYVWNWSCTPLYGGTVTANCSAPMRLDGTCGTASGVATYEEPQAKYAFGGVWSSLYNNPITGAKSCPAGYTFQGILGYSGIDYGLGYCIKTLAPGEAPAWDFGGMWGEPYASYANPVTGAKNCPAGFTQTTVLGTSGVDYAVNICWRAHVYPGDKAFFGGAWGEPNAAYFNWVTGAKSCPTGYAAATILGYSGVDYAITFCYKIAPTLCGIGTSTGTTTAEGAPYKYDWTCSGINGGNTAACSAPMLYTNGVCGTASGVVSTTAPVAAPTTVRCATGTSSAVTVQGAPGFPAPATPYAWKWSCAPLLGGDVTANCSAPLRAAGTCGAAAGVTTFPAPTINFCNTGSTAVINTNSHPTYTYTWVCAGPNGGANSATCTAPMRYENGVCGTASSAAAAGGTYVAPSTNLCTATGGDPTAVTMSGTTHWVWQCLPNDGGVNTASCSNLVRRDGVCGTGNGVAAYSVATAAQCSAGSPSNYVTGATTFTWRCNRLNGTIVDTANYVSCSAPRMIDGVCGPLHGTTSCANPAGTCTAAPGGKTADVIVAPNKTWSCLGINGGDSPACWYKMGTMTWGPASAWMYSTLAPIHYWRYKPTATINEYLVWNGTAVRNVNNVAITSQFTVAGSARYNRGAFVMTNAGYDYYYINREVWGCY